MLMSDFKENYHTIITVIHTNLYISNPVSDQGFVIIPVSQVCVFFIFNPGFGRNNRNDKVYELTMVKYEVVVIGVDH